MPCSSLALGALYHHQPWCSHRFDPQLPPQMRQHLPALQLQPGLGSIEMDCNEEFTEGNAE